MNKLYKVFIISLVLQIVGVSQLLAQSPETLWAKGADGSNSNNLERGRSVTVDASGNIYATGSFFHVISFGNIRLHSNGGDDAFIAKYDAAGNVLWARSFGGSAADNGHGIAVNASGDIFVTGYFTGTTSFSGTTLTSMGTDLFIAKYDASGNEIWAKNIEGPEISIGHGIALDGNGGAYVTGYFGGTVSFGATTLTSAGGYDAFIAKYDAAGNVLWAKQAGGTNWDSGYSVAVDGSGNIIVTGRFSGTANFGSLTLTSADNSSTFIAKYDAAGNVLWAKQAGGSGIDYRSGVAIDGSGNILVTGHFFTTASFDAITLTNAGNSDAFIAKYDGAGNVLWAKQISGTSAKYSHSVAVDGTGNAYISGSFQGMANFGGTTLTSAGSFDAFIAKYDATGNVLWARHAGGTNWDSGYSVAVNSAGDTYVVGDYQGQATFDHSMITSSGSYDMFIAKYNSSGNLSWVKSPSGIGAANYGRSITQDSQGNVLVAGHFYGTLSFGAINLTSAGSSDIFIAKYDPAGNVLWAKQAGGGNGDNISAITVDASGNFLVTGHFTGTVSFGATTLTSAGGYDAFIAKFDAAGNVLWAKSAGGASYDYGRGITVSQSGSVYVTGYFQETLEFGATTLTNAGGYDAFIAKFDAAGNVLWAKSAGGTGNDFGYDIAVDGSENAYVTGNFKETAAFGTTTLASAGNSNIYIAKYDASGNTVWAKRTAHALELTSSSITVDASGNTYVTGSFQGAAEFGATTHTSAGGLDAFIAKFDAAGNILWVKQMGGASGNEVGTGIAVNGSNNAYVTGHFTGTANFGSTTLTSDGSSMFITKLSNEGNLTSFPKAELQSILLYPNPTSDKLKLSLPVIAASTLEIKLLDAKGQIILKETFRNVSVETNYTIDLRGQAKGMYLLQLITDQGMITKRVVKN